MRKFWFNPNTFGNGFLWLVAVAMQIGGWVNQIFAYILLGIAFLWTLCTIIYWLKWSKKEIPIVKGQPNLDISKYLIDTLKKIHSCDLLLKEKSVKQYLALFNGKDFRELLDNLAHRQKGYQEVFNNIKKDVGRKKLSKYNIKRHQQIDNLSDKLITSPMMMKGWSLTEIVEFCNLLDKLPEEQNAKYKGVRKLRTVDRQWNKCFKKLQDIKIEFAYILADDNLRKLIDDYIDASFAGSSLLILVDLLNKFVPGLLPTTYISSGAYAPYETILSYMTSLLLDIDRRIDTLIKPSMPYKEDS